MSNYKRILSFLFFFWLLVKHFDDDDIHASIDSIKGLFIELIYMQPLSGALICIEPDFDVLYSSERERDFNFNASINFSIYIFTDCLY